MSEPMTSQSAFLFPDPSSSSTQQAIFTSFSPGQTYITSEPVTNSQPNPQTSNNFQNQQFQQYHTATLSSNNAKFPYLKKEEYETWAMKMEYWIIETKARTLLLQSLPEDHMTDFHHLDDAREIWLAVKARFGGNEESKKIRKTMLKQEFSEFSAKPDNDDVNMKFLKALPPSWSQVALTLKKRGGLEYLSFDDLYNKLRSLEINVKGGSSYGSRGTTIALTHSAFIGAASTNTKMVYSDQPSHSSSITYTSAHSGSIIKDALHSFVDENGPTQQLAYEDFEQGEQVYGLMAGFKSNFAYHAGNANGSVYDAAAEFAMMGISPKAKIEKKEWKVKLVESLARFDKWKESSKNLAKLINSSMSTRTKLGLRFKEYIGSDEVFNLSTPSVFDPEPENREVKSLYESDKSSESETYDFASCVSSPKTNNSFSTIDVKILPKSDVKDPNNFPSVVLKAAYVPAGSRNSSTSTSAGRCIPATSRNRPASIHAGRHIHAGRFNKPAPFLVGRSVPTGWTNHAARPFFRPTNLHFDNVHPHVNKDIGIVDNQSTICIVKNPVFHQRIKHIEIRHHFIRDANEKNLIQVLKIQTDENVADLLTKAFDGPRFYYLALNAAGSTGVPADGRTSRNCWSLADEDAHAFWRDQESWRIRSWRLYPHAHVYVLEIVDGRVIYMFVNVSYPLSEATLERMLRHGMEVPKLLVGGDLTMAEQLVRFIKADLLNAQSAV
uniref:Xylulose kinase-1 n=1 Tax=Tanacetum cinerariifolium TaxID=118510 RepID=A0A6L2LF16_TANCI|nr:xylulose kinase-1 [Tanacetum cinerariifolium]